MVRRYQRSSLAVRQHRAVVEHVASQGMGTLCAARGRSRPLSLVLVRPAPIADTWRKLAFCSADNHLTVNHLIRLRVRSGHKNFLTKERGT